MLLQKQQAIIILPLNYSIIIYSFHSPYPCFKIPLIFLGFCEMYMLLYHSFVHPLAIYHLLIHLQLINGRGGSVG